ncbi:MAG: Ig-like domain-containing protein [Tannerellaceae bacterium]|jgi:uncharacterized protein YjdB|nr:Ig-like domain-containing protein [Tannerellaceae bacterium]
MKKTINIIKTTLLILCGLCITTAMQATIRTVTERGVNVAATDKTTPGTYIYEIQQMQDGDTLMFDAKFANDTIYAGYNPFNTNKSQDSMIFTIIGNGVTMKGHATSLSTAISVSRPLKKLTVENMRYIGNVSITNCIETHFKNCIFRNSETDGRAIKVTGETVFEGCAFFATGGGTGILKVHVNVNNASTQFVSCTFYTNASTTYASQNYGSIISVTTSSNIVTTLTNCVLIDEHTDDTNCAIYVNNSAPVSNGYNVIHGLVNAGAYDPNPSWKQPTDAYFRPDTAVAILTPDAATGGYRVHVGTVADQGPAYRRLPPNPNNLVPDVAFPKYDLDSTLIDYTKPTHSGAWQAIDGPDLAIVEAATGIIISSGTTTDITTSEMFSEETLQLNASVTPNNVAQAVQWASDKPLIASIDQNGLVTAPAATYTEPQTVTLTCTTTEAKDAGNQFLTATVTLTVKPYVHVSAVTLQPTLDLAVGIKHGLRAVIAPANVNNPALAWTVDNPAVKLTKVANDTVTLQGMEPCTAVVTAIAADGSIAATCNVTVSHADYSDGVFFVNEDWFGHSFSTINFLHADGHWSYRVFQAANPENGDGVGQPLTLGTTAQYGTIYGDKIYTVQKQPGKRHAFASDARTMQVIRYDAPWTGIDQLPASDGRAYLQLNDSIGYESTSNGILKYDYSRLEVTSLSGTTTGGGLYTGQAGTMRRVGDFIFVVQQNVGLLVIDAHNHTLYRTLTDYNYATLTQSKDGYLWTGTTKQASQGQLGEETTHNIIVRIDPWTLEQTEILLPEGYTGPPATWGAWQFDPIWGSTKENVLYWANGSKKICRYDIDANTAETVLDLTDYISPDGRGPANTSGGWAMYGTSFGIHPETDELYVSVSLFNMSAPNEQRAVWQVLKVDPHTKQITGTYPLTDHYWFIAMPVFTDKYSPEFISSAPFPSTITLNDAHPADTLRLGDKVTDRDNMDAAIIISVEEGYNRALINPVIWRDSLIITPRKNIPAGQPSESTQITLKFNSNGHVIYKELTVTVGAGAIAYPVTGVTLNRTTADLAVGETLQLTATIAPPNATNKSVTWQSVQPLIASVDDNGLVTAHLAPGSVDIIVTTLEGAYTDTCTVTTIAPSTPGVVENPFELTHQSLALSTGQTAQLALTAPQHFTTAWRSTAATVATVTSTGLVTAIAPGTALIIAGDASKGKADTCTVTVLTAAYTLTLNTSTLTLMQGGRSTLQLVVSPQQTGLTPQWSSSNASIADVTAAGTVIGISPGTALITAKLGTATAVCAVTITAPVTQLTVSGVSRNEANVAFPQADKASYYLAHVYELTSGGITPFLSLKITPDGQVTLRAAAGNNILVPIQYLKSATSYVVHLETIHETGGKAEVIKTEVIAFTTAGPTGILAPEIAEPNAWYADGSLHLRNLNGYDCTLTALSGQVVGHFRIDDTVAQRSLSLSSGMYILNATNAQRRSVFKIIIR